MLTSIWMAVGDRLFWGTSFQGTWADRTRNLFELDVQYGGASILDVGCNMGVVGLEICKCEPARYHGIEKMAAHNFVAKAVLQGTGVDCRVDRIDIANEKERQRTLDTRYDIVLYLAVHQHVRRQVGEDRAAAVLDDLLARTEKYFVFRGPDYKEAIRAAENAGFSLCKMFPRDRLHPICSFVRKSD